MSMVEDEGLKKNGQHTQPRIHSSLKDPLHKINGEEVPGGIAKN